jgi:hypothetical protein
LVHSFLPSLARWFPHPLLRSVIRARLFVNELSEYFTVPSDWRLNRFTNIQIPVIVIW